MAKFKDVIDALEAGKKVRRESWRRGSFIVNSGGRIVTELGTPFHLLDKDDWEIVEPTVTITKKQLREAFMRAQKESDTLLNYFGINTDVGDLANKLAYFLGLEEWPGE